MLELGVGEEDPLGDASCEGVELRVRPELADGVPSWVPELVTLGAGARLGLPVPLIEGDMVCVGEGEAVCA